MKTPLQYLGLRTSCCNAKIATWHSNKQYCASCERWLDKPSDQPAAKTKSAFKRRSVS